MLKQVASLDLLELEQLVFLLDFDLVDVRQLVFDLEQCHLVEPLVIVCSVLPHLRQVLHLLGCFVQVDLQV